MNENKRITNPPNESHRVSPGLTRTGEIELADDVPCDHWTEFIELLNREEQLVEGLADFLSRRSILKPEALKCATDSSVAEGDSAPAGRSVYRLAEVVGEHEQRIRADERERTLGILADSGRVNVGIHSIETGDCFPLTRDGIGHVLDEQHPPDGPGLSEPDQ